MARTRIRPRKRTGDIPRRKKYYRPTKKGAGVLPGDKKGGKFVGSKKESIHNKKFRRMYG